MYFRVAVIAVVLAVMCWPSESEKIHTIAKSKPRPFLNGLSADVKAKFWAVAKDKKLTVKQMRKKQLELAKKNGFEDKLKKFYKDTEKKGKKLDEQRIAILKKLPGLYKKYMDIADDSKTMDNILKQRKALVAKNKKAFSAIRALMSS
ncbi:hypothetical protein ANCDUO_14014 [Ancylostoma duodenale]|uniref:SXP/RAL-2 family protein Ani s 5-like cation-binding domain-containing protein n=1 Tax=Ancylostoma duodenale TaxID=51022 RepID=A0A0C2G4A8_9BILA|nr:hypothetical protein ANCDUO_14014 [Ancylostoma duodenale]